jgi:cellulose synthase/poly-beta-1,6-N-acetylglucosamine synthase-like glycosyltransferase
MSFPEGFTIKSELYKKNGFFMSKKKFPKVSFVIPALNAENFLPSCIISIRTQHYPQNKIEILIVDGGSTDRTLEIAKKYNAVILKK